MLAVGGRPLLWHIMRGLAEHGSDEFVLALGHLGHVVKDYFLSFQIHAGDFTARLGRQPVVPPLGEWPEEGWPVSRLATVIASSAPARFGHLDLRGDRVQRLREKEPGAADDLVNIGYLVLEREVLERYVPAGSDLMFEEEPVRRLATDAEPMAYRHPGRRRPVYTPKELADVRRLWDAGAAPWTVWR